MNIIYTKKDFLDILSTMGIEAGMVVLVQADLDNFGCVLGNEQALIEALKELVQKDGCIIVPTFSFSCLDPACGSKNDFSYESWSMIRDNHLGFDKALTPCSVYKAFGDQFLKNEEVVRTNHPIFSFAYWGTYDEKCLDQPLHFPISFGRVLREFVDRKAINLLIGVDKDKSLLFDALAKTMNQGIVTLKRAIIHKPNGNQLKNFLSLEVDQENIKEYLDMCYIQSKEYQGKWIHMLSLDTNEESK